MTDFKKRISGFKTIGILYSLLISGLFVYSFTQVDLDLTLSRWSVWQIAEKFFQSLGYFERPLSTYIYVAILLLMFIFYGLFLVLANKKILTKKNIWILIFFTAIVLAFSYNAFSYDLFNYIFDAKIITHYHQNPYLHKALDYTGDPMLSFMHWTHRTYPYGPVWILLTVPLSFLGFGFFLPTFFLFKFLMTGSYLGTVYFLSRIIKKINPANEIFGIVLFAFNPLVIIESLVSGHNDIVMMFLAVLSLYLLIKKKYLFSFLFILASIGIKFATAFLLPVYLLIFLTQLKDRKIDKKIYLILICIMILPVVIASVRTNFQPWYLLYILPFAPIFAGEYFILIPVFIMSIVSLLEYAPFLYLGNWNPPVPSILTLLTDIGIGMSILFSFVWFIIGKRFKKA